jgi:hypothetical protein
MVVMQAAIQPQGRPFADERDEPRRTSTMPPSFGVAAVASVAGLRDSHGNFPLDACVPVRTNTKLKHVLDWHAFVVLLEVDGTQSLQEIATRTDISLPDCIAGCLDLVAQGVVEVSSHASEAST